MCHPRQSPAGPRPSIRHKAKWSSLSTPITSPSCAGLYARLFGEQQLSTEARLCRPLANPHLHPATTLSFRGRQESPSTAPVSQQTHTHMLNGSAGLQEALELKGSPARSLFLYQTLECGYSRSHCWSEMAQNDQLCPQTRTSLFQ